MQKHFSDRFLLLAALLSALLVTACAVQPTLAPAAVAAARVTGAPALPTQQPSATAIPTAEPASTFTTLPSPNAADSGAAAADPTAPTSGPAAPRLCSPLAGIPLSEINTLVSNPFHPPKPGSDEPHQGVDLAIRQPGTNMALAGNPVQAALPGVVAMVTQDRFPFGNAVIIETPLDAYPADGWAAAPIPTPAPTVEIHSALTCPAAPTPQFADPNRRSLYILYAHLQEPAPVKVEDLVACGQEIGRVGQSGNALNPHLHFEVKVGPAGLRLSSMAHYDASASLEEMSNYCLWSISSLLQLVDPLGVLGLEQVR